MAVNKENVRKWVEALRSGDYKQTKNKLAVSDRDGQRSYCCLGVACEVSGLGEWDSDDSPYALTYKLPGRMRSEDYELPPAVQRWLGVRTPDGIAKTGIVDGDNIDRSLIYLNDDLEYSFDQIADVIEEKLLND